MAMPNKLGLSDEVELARAEERISKAKAYHLFASAELDRLVAGSWQALVAIHHALFADIYEFAGLVRTVNIAKGSFRFVPVMYLEAVLKNIEAMPQATYADLARYAASETGLD